LEPDAIRLGHDLVSDNCSGCHSVEKTGDGPHATAPHFRDLHQRYDVDFLMEALVEGVIAAHPDMPEFQFSVENATAIVAYLKSLE
jgi:mono/diheme cytochrome c family protein